MAPSLTGRSGGLDADELGDEARDLGRVRADADAAGLERFLLRLGGAGGVPEMIAPAWPMVFPGGAVKPAM